MRKFAVATLVAVVTLMVPSPAGADRWCDDNAYGSPGNDQRSASEKLPKQGVIEVQRYDWGTYYSPRTIEEDGSKGYISLNGTESSTPIVSAWQPPAKCFGSAGSTRTGGWGVTPWGQIFTDSTYAPHFGDMNGQHLNKPVVGMAPTANGEGYWLFAGDGGIFTFGNARFLGSTGGMGIPAPIVAMAATPTNNGYWMAGSDGSIYNFGDARAYGSMRGTALNQPVVGMVPTPTGRGYWMVAADGGIFTFGDAVFKGSTANQRPATPIVGMVPYGTGYAIVTENGTVYPFQ